MHMDGSVKAFRFLEELGVSEEIGIRFDAYATGVMPIDLVPQSDRDVEACFEW
jgi:hypothetical protein